MAIYVRTMGILAVQMPGEISIEPDPAAGLTLRALIFDRLASQHEPCLPSALFDAQGKLKQGYTILVDGRNAMQLGGLDLVLRDGANVLITAMVSGG